jgi:hypothetical protein
MSDELMIKMVLLTAWILMAFLRFALNGAPLKTGTALFRDKARAFSELLFTKIFPTSENFSKFLLFSALGARVPAPANCYSKALLSNPPIALPNLPIALPFRPITLPSLPIALPNRPIALPDGLSALSSARIALSRARLRSLFHRKRSFP